MTTCSYCGWPEPDDDHTINCLATSSVDAYIEEERLGLHGPQEDAPLTKAERRFVNKT